MKLIMPLIQENLSLQPYNTFGLAVKTKFFAEANSIQNLKLLIENFPDKAVPKMILGGGSNILFTQDFPGLIIKNALSGFDILHEDKNYVHLKIGAGENWHNTVLRCVENGWGGVENLSLIPGTVGAAPIQNIGAYGVELKETFHELTALSLKDGSERIFNAAECEFGYRDSIFKNACKNQYMICSVTLKLSKKPKLNTTYGLIQETLKNMGVTQPTLKSVSDAVIHIRQTKLPDPKKIGNAGSFFKNPEISLEQFSLLKKNYSDVPHFYTAENKIKIPAAWLIEQCGWKGKRFGNIGVHDKQALVLVNYGNGQGSEIKKLAEQIQSSVQEKFSIHLAMEVNLV